MTVNVLIIGGGGREHVIAWKLSKSSEVAAIFVAPGNAGTASEEKTSNVDLNVSKFDAVVKFCREKIVSFVVVGPEKTLADGIVDHLKAAGIRCFGPCKAAAQCESDKAFSKAFLKKHSIPTARFEVFTDSTAAIKHIKTCSYNAWVLKATGLASGKGVTVASSIEEACVAAKHLLDDKPYGSACDTIVVEELLVGDEVSVLCFTDGETIRVMPPAQDHKRLLEGDYGPMTGGMGAYCPCNEMISKEFLEIAERDILLKTVQCLKKDGIEYKGVLYAGLMITSDGPMVLEFNCRFGDPEAQSILSLLKSDLYDILSACENGTLVRCHVEWYDKTYASGVVLASRGYPDNPKTCVVVETDLRNLPTFLNYSFVKVFHAGTERTSSGSIRTSGGRVFCPVAVSSRSLNSALQAATTCASLIHFDGAYYRKDIGYRSLMRIRQRNEVSPAVTSFTNGFTYESAGVSISRANAFVDGIKNHCKSTARSGANVDIGGFGGFFDLKAAGFSDPLLVSGTDGVGTKLKIAHMCNEHDTVGIDLVAMCANDILVHGAEPLFFLDYFATGQLNVAIATQVVSGIAEGCRQANCALIGGETAEMPGFYSGSEYDLAGFCVGAVNRDKCLPRTQEIVDGDIILGIPSSGVHSNGFSLVRKIVESSGYKYSDPCPWQCDEHVSIGKNLLTPTKIYIRSLLPALKSGKVKAAAHITGGGLLENLIRVFPDNLSANLDARSWVVSPVFCWLSHVGKVSSVEMSRAFNCGIGMALVVANSDANDVIEMIKTTGEQASRIGVMVPVAAEPRVHIHWLNDALKWDSKFAIPRSLKPKVRVAVLISGSGTNLQALIDHIKNPVNNSVCEIVLVVSNVANVKGLERAQSAGIPTKTIDHKAFKDRVKFDMAVNEQLKANEVQLICLAGFMRILSEPFCSLWHGKMLNIHPSLLPSFKGAHAVRDALASGVRVTGATVHFVVPDVDSGAIVCQEAVPVLTTDDESTLHERIHVAEYKILPKAMELVARGEAVLCSNSVVQWK